MLLLFEKGIRGGIIHAAERCAKPDNKYMKKNQYNPDTNSTHLQYLDENNLYGWTMIQKLPSHGLAWRK